jgi:6,7-dimethyl-8-ribityllumazine synthase
MRMAIVWAEFNYDITSKMAERAKEHIHFLGAEVGDVVSVPGSFDIPLVLRKLLQKKDVDAVVTLGAVLKGDTDHDQVVAQHAARKIMDLALESGKPVALGIIGPGASRAQAEERIDEYAKRAVEAAAKMANKMK